jgi:peptide/nickel transport system permease protein
MWQYFLKRVFWSIVTIFVIVIVNFVLIKLVPGDPVHAMIGDFPAPQDYIDQLRRDFGLDQPLHVQLWLYLGNLAQGNFGFSFANRQPVLDLILGRTFNTLLLILPAIVFSAIIGIALSLAAASRGGAFDLTVSAITLFGYSIPVFWLGQVLVLIFAITLGALPTSGMYSLRAPQSGFGAFLDLLRHMILPLACIMAFKIAVFSRTARASILGVLNSDFVMTARAKGLSRGYTLWRHILPNAIIPVIAVFGYQFGHALTSSLLVETVFAWPGVGQLFVTAVGQRDFPVLQGILLLSTILVVVANVLADLLYTIVDPRIRRSLGARHA